MNILFLHQNFPGQFKFLAPVLAARGDRVLALTMQQGERRTWQGVDIIPYKITRSSAKEIHPWVTDFETKIIRAEAVLRACQNLKADGFTPDRVIAHPGWGESLFIKEVWPEAHLSIFCEFFYLRDGADTGFDPEFSEQDSLSDNCRLKIKNLNNNLHFEIADDAISPTRWQASTFPEPFRKKITVVHDGIDTNKVAPNPNVSLQVRRGDGEPHTLTKNDEVVTFVNRNLEPMRGFHTFMRALPKLLDSRPNARAVVVGGTGVSYGTAPTKEKHGYTSWKDVFMAEIASQMKPDYWSRVHFVGQLPYSSFVSLLQLSSAHIYLTYPFVLSWSMLEAMSAGAAVIGSATAPVQEVIKHGVNGLLVDFFQPNQLADTIAGLLDNREQQKRLGEAARQTVLSDYDLHSVCLPKQLNWVDGK